MRHIHRSLPLVDALEGRRLFAVTVPKGFTETVFATGLDIPTAAAFSPDGRLFVTQKSGELEVVKDGAVLEAPALTLDVDQDGERGLLGVAFDPAFSTNSFVYLYYTVPADDVVEAHNRISRFVLDGDTIDPGSETVLLDLPALAASNHNGGAIHFGADGKLYAAVGENGDSSNAPRLDSPLGKILRLNSDGTVPLENPFLGFTSGINQYIYAKGLRNPFTFAVQPVTGLTYLNDVGENAFEEIDELAPGADYGWPNSEGPTKAESIVSPIASYKHPAGNSGGIAIVGGAFMKDGGYYFGDLSLGFINRLDVATHKVSKFATGFGNLTGMIAGPDDSLYVISYAGAPDGEILKIAGAFAPANNTPPVPVLKGPKATAKYVAGSTIKFTLGATDKQDKAFPASAFMYSVQRIVDGGTPETVATGRNTKALAFAVPADNAGLGNNVVYRFSLTAVDAAGASATVSRDLSPQLSTVTIKPSLPKGLVAPANLSFTLDGSAFAPGTFTSIAGTTHTLTVPTTITAADTTTLLFGGFSGVVKGTTPGVTFKMPSGNATLLVKYVRPVR